MTTAVPPVGSSDAVTGDTTPISDEAVHPQQFEADAHCLGFIEDASQPGFGYCGPCGWPLESHSPSLRPAPLLVRGEPTDEEILHALPYSSIPDETDVAEIRALFRRAAPLLVSAEAERRDEFPEHLIAQRDEAQAHLAEAELEADRLRAELAERDAKLREAMRVSEWRVSAKDDEVFAIAVATLTQHWDCGDGL